MNFPNIFFTMKNLTSKEQRRLFEERIFEITDPISGIVCPVFGWIKFCKLWRDWYGKGDELSRKQKCKENNVPVYRKAAKIRPAITWWYNVLREPYSAL